jgi:CubicO group peptidase (beta-lactamase class C family)
MKLMVALAMLGLAAGGGAPAAARLPEAPSAPRAELLRGIDRQAPRWLRQHDVPAVAIAWIAAGKVAWVRAYGEQSPGVAASPDTLFNVASLAKPVTAEVILRLASRGRLSLDEPMSAHWIDPDLREDPRHAGLTPLIALTHRTGFENWRPNDGPLKFNWDPGSRTGYSGEGFNYLGRFAEKKLGRPFEDLARETVFRPLGMRDSHYSGAAALADRVATVQGPDGSRRLPDAPPRWSGADDLHISVSDYARFVAAVMKDRGLDPAVAARRGKVFENMVSMACPPAKIAPELCPKSVAFGLGWVVFDNGRETVMMHGGGDWGERTLAFFVPKRRLGMVVFTSGANGQKVIRDAVAMLYPHNPEFNAFLAMQAAN